MPTPDIAGAIAAIEARATQNWTTTRIVFVNEQPAPPWPPVDTNNNNARLPYLVIEVVNTTSDLRTVGQPGNQFWLYQGLIHGHVFVPFNTGLETARQYASQFGEIFRNAVFYNSTSGYQVRGLSPRIDGGGQGTDDNLYSRVTATIPFEYYHRG